MSLWDSHAECLSLDHTLQHGNVQELGVNEAFGEIAQYLEEYGKRFQDYGLLEPTSYGQEVEHEMSRWNHDPDRLAAGKRTRRVDVTYPVFAHGQLYTALSRIRNRSNAVIRLQPSERTTTNITYKELLLL